MKRKGKIAFLALLVLSILVNIRCALTSSDKLWYVNFYNANTRDNYETIHHIKEAQNISTGKGVKVGIIDKYFGFKKHEKVYTGGKDFLNSKEKFEQIDEHGFWMATTLKEIAPNVEIYALNARCSDKAKEANAIVSAIDWAIENKIDILTYSGEPFAPQFVGLIDSAVSKANSKGIVTTFIHYTYPTNTLPYILSPNNDEGYSREPDINIFHFDYNLLLLDSYKKYLKANRKPTSGDATPFLSLSSMSPVAAGIVAMMMEVNHNLSPLDYKQILIDTSREMDYKGSKITHVVDAPSAIKLAKSKIK
ncbi:MAG: peptidase [Bacteroidales bacterium]|nr:MAG: peptidase [Bacteroidales bacterium]